MPSETPGRRVRDAADARDLLAQIAASGQPLATWCRAHGVNRHSLYHWRGRLADDRRHTPKRRPKRSAEPPALRFAELLTPRPPARYLLTLPNGVRLELEEDFTDEAVTRLLALASRC